MSNLNVLLEESSPNETSANVSSANVSYDLPKRTRALGKRLLTQQCWCWGQDVRHDAGNLLMKYGFERQRPPQGESGATTYRLQLLPNRVVVLWGFGFWYGETGRGGIFVGRFDFESKLFETDQPPSPIWSPHQIDGWEASMGNHKNIYQHDLQYGLLCRGLNWITAYENWVREHTEPDYRQRCLVAWSQKFVAPEEVVPTWERLARTLKDRPRARKQIKYS